MKYVVPLHRGLTRRELIKSASIGAIVTLASCGGVKQIRIDRELILEKLPGGIEYVPLSLGGLDIDIPLKDFRENREFYKYKFHVTRGFELNDFTPSTRIPLESLRPPRRIDGRFSTIEQPNYFRYVALRASEVAVGREHFGVGMRLTNKIDEALQSGNYVRAGELIEIQNPNIVTHSLYTMADPSFNFMGQPVGFQVDKTAFRSLKDKYPVGRGLSMRLRISSRVGCVIQLTEANVALQNIPTFLKSLEAEILAILTPASRAALNLSYE